MGAVVLAHVDHFRSLGYRTESCLADGFRTAHKGDDGAIGGLAGVYVEQTYALH